MPLDVGANDLVKVHAIRPAALGLANAFIDVTGQRTGTIGAGYTPTWIGEPGHMTQGVAKPLDNLTGTGDVSIAHQQTAQGRDELIRDSDAWP